MSTATASPPLTQQDAEKLRDSLQADQGKTSETLSSIARSIATGLALITYAFFFGKEQSGFVTSHFKWLLFASLFGLLALFADGCQYLAAIFQGRALRDYMKKHFPADHVTFQNIDDVRAGGFGKARDFLFWFKLLLAAAGVLIVISVIARAILGFS